MIIRSTILSLVLTVCVGSEATSSRLPSVVNESSNIYKCPLWLGSCNNRTCNEVSTRNRAIKCSGYPQWFILHCYCITEYHKNHSVLVTGLCPYTCSSKLLENGISLPMDDSISETICGPSQRKGQFCGKCKENHAPAAYSYSDDCVICTEYKWNWVKYIAMAYGPQTIFFIVIVLTKTSVTSGWMVGYVTVSQLIATSIESRFRTSELKEESTLINSVFPTIYGIWNLDFFKDIYTPFCVHPDQTTLAAIAMDYTVALYPIVLLLVTYIILEGFNRYTATRSCWMPIYKIRHSYRKYCDFRGSVIDAFAAVLILSYVKILNTSTELLLHTPIVNLQGEILDRVVYYNGSMKFFGKDHAPYALLSIIMLLVFNVFPVIIVTLYPFQCFQSFLNRHVATKVKLNFIHLVMDVFYRSYKLKRRGFAVIYIYIRLLTFALLMIILNPVYVGVVSVIFFCSATVIGLTRPHQKMSHNVINCFFLCLVGIIRMTEFLVHVAFSVYPDSLEHKGRIIISILYFVLPTYLILSIIKGFLPSTLTRRLSKVLHNLFERFKNKNHNEHLEQNNSGYGSTNTDEYAKLIEVNE